MTAETQNSNAQFISLLNQKLFVKGYQWWLVGLVMNNAL